MKYSWHVGFDYSVCFHHNILRSRQRRCSIKEGVLKNFATFTGKHLCQSLFFNKVAGLSTVNFEKFLRTTFLTEDLRWLLLSIIAFASIVTIFIDHIWFLFIENVLLEIVSQNDFIT